MPVWLTAKDHHREPYQWPRLWVCLGLHDERFSTHVIGGCLSKETEVVTRVPIPVLHRLGVNVFSLIRSNLVCRPCSSRPRENFPSFDTSRRPSV